MLPFKAGRLDEADQLVSQAEQVESRGGTVAQQLARQARRPPTSGCCVPRHDARSVRGDIAMTGLHYATLRNIFRKRPTSCRSGTLTRRGDF